jgi:hypothetical protein
MSMPHVDECRAPVAKVARTAVAVADRGSDAR